MLSPNVNMILTAKVSQGTGKKYFLIEVEDGEIESTDADKGSDKESDKGSEKGSDNESHNENAHASAHVPVRTLIHSHDWNVFSG